MDATTIHSSPLLLLLIAKRIRTFGQFKSIHGHVCASSIDGPPEVAQLTITIQFIYISGSERTNDDDDDDDDAGLLRLPV